MIKTILTYTLFLMHAFCYASAPTSSFWEQSNIICPNTDQKKVSRLMNLIEHFDILITKAENNVTTQCLKNVTSLLDENPELINRCDQNGNTPLMHVVKHYTHSMFQLIVSYKPNNVNALNNKNHTALFLAMATLKFPAFKQLLDLNPDLSITDDMGKTIYEQATHTLQRITDLSKTVPVRSNKHKEYVEQKCCLERMLRLIPDNIILQDPPAPNPQELLRAQTILDTVHQIKRFPRGDLVDMSHEWHDFCSEMFKIKAFFDKDPGNINSTEPLFDGNTIFMYAAQSPNLALRNYCYSLNPHINAQNKRKQTALHLAVFNASPQALKHLVDKGIDQTIVDDEGNTAKMRGQKRSDRISGFITSINSHPGEFRLKNFSKSSICNELCQEKSDIEEKLSFLA